MLETVASNVLEQMMRGRKILTELLRSVIGIFHPVRFRAYPASPGAPFRADDPML